MCGTAEEHDISHQEEGGGSSSRWALGTLVLVALASSEISGAGTIAALPIASITVTLAAICKSEKPAPTQTTRRSRGCRDLLDFLMLWLSMLSQLTASATCARIASATMDYMSQGRSRVWLFGYESHSLGEPWPDVLGLTIIVVITAMFMLGLDNSTSLTILLNTGIICSLIFFTLVGGLHADFSSWSQHEFLPTGWEGMLTAAAMCSFGFIDEFPKPRSRRRGWKIFGMFLVPLLSYSVVTVLFTLMTRFREFTERGNEGTAIPLVKVFEVRDVDWARPVMASCTIAVVSIALTEICPKIYKSVVTLADKEWRILAKSLAYENQSTGSAVLAIFTAGSLSAILAFACPLSYLVRLLNVSPLISHMLHATAIIYDRYQPENDVEDFPGIFTVYTDVGYSRLNQGSSSKPSSRRRTEQGENTVRGLKYGLWFLPRTVRQTHSFLQEASTDGGISRGKSEERECLLMGEYSPEYVKTLERAESNLDLDSDGNEDSVKFTDPEDEDSSTDIDAIVEEYKEKLKVATTLTGNFSGTMRLPSLASGRRVLVSVLFIFLGSIALGVGALFEYQTLVWPAIAAMLLFATITAWQPQKPRTVESCTMSGPAEGEQYTGYRVPLMPWLPTLSIALNAVLAAFLMPEIWLGVILWTGAGLILFCRCDCYCCDCEGYSSGSRERIKLRAPPRGSVVSTLVPSHRRLPKDSQRRLTHVDTILIAR